MKYEYKCIESWVVENPDGTKVEIYLGDKVRVRVDEKRIDLTDTLMGKMENPIDFRVVSLSKLKFKGESLIHKTHYFHLTPKDIIEITKL